MFGTPQAKDPVMPPEYAAMKAPTDKNTSGAAKIARNRLRAKSSTLLTGANGVGAADTSGKKVLLGQ
jgi:hypothetical protein